MDTVFYSWQSDLPSNTNRGFILEALKRACKRISADGTVQVEARVDHDTLGEAGAPDIAETILRKIEAASAFVADVSIVARGEGRSFPNPNVVLELGFAIKALGLNRVIPVFNKTTGEPSELPFDLRMKRVLTYRRGEDGGGESRSEVARRLRIAVQEVLVQQVSRDKEHEIADFLLDLCRLLITIAAYADEWQERRSHESQIRLQERFGMYADKIRGLATAEASQVLGATSEIEQIGDALDIVCAHQGHKGDSREYALKIAATREASRSLLEDLMAQNPIDARLREQAVIVVFEQANRVVPTLAERLARMEAKDIPLDLDKALSELSVEGQKLLFVLGLGLPARLADKKGEAEALGSELHLMKARHSGPRTPERVHEALSQTQDLAERVCELAAEMVPKHAS